MHSNPRYNHVLEAAKHFYLNHTDPCIPLREVQISSCPDHDLWEIPKIQGKEDTESSGREWLPARDEEKIVETGWTLGDSGYPGSDESQDDDTRGGSRRGSDDGSIDGTSRNYSPPTSDGSDDGGSNDGDSGCTDYSWDEVHVPLTQLVGRRTNV